MSIKYIKLLLVLNFFLYIQANASSSKDEDPKNSASKQEPPKKDDHGSKKDDHAEKKDEKKKIPPLPRHVLLPPVTYSRSPDVEGEFTVDFSKHKFWILVLIATWNKRSVEVTQILNSHMQDFRERNIGTLGLYAQNGEKDVEKWKAVNIPLFHNFFASRNFLDSMKNPKIPMIILLGNKGEILLKYELPSLQQIDATIQKSFVLTGF